MYEDLDMHTRARCLVIEDERAGVRLTEQMAPLRQECPWNSAA